MQRIRLWLWGAAVLWAVVLVGMRVWHPAAGPAGTVVLSPGQAASAADAGVQVVPAKAAPGSTYLGGTTAPGFTLIDQFGQTRSLKSFRGKTVVLTFIDSRCTTTCPVTAAALRETLDALPVRSRRDIALVAVNVNAAANRVADVRTWSAEHGMLHAWTFLTGSRTALAKVWKDYFVSVSDPGNNPNAVQHTAAVYIIDRQGKEAYLSIEDASATAGEEARPLVADLRRLLGVKSEARVQATAPRPGTMLAAIAPGGAGTQVDLGGGRVRLVDFFATWCHACNIDLATLSQYQKATASTHLPPVVAVDLRLAEPSTAYVKKFAAARALPFPVALDATGKVTDAYGVTDLPTMVLVDGQGKVLWRHTGVMALGPLEAAVRSHLPPA